MASKIKEEKFNIQQKKTSALIQNLFDKANIPQEEIPKQSWSQLDNIYNSLASSILEIAENFNESIRVINSIGISNNQELVITVKGLTSDLNTFTTDLLTIKKMHEGKSGDIEDPDELALCLGVFQSYSMLNDRFKAIVFPTIITITEAIAEAMENIEKAKAAAPITIEGEVQIVKEGVQ